MARLFDDGQAEYLEIASAVVAAAPFTVSAWVYPDADAADLTVFSLGDSAVHKDYWKLHVHGNVANDPVCWTAYATVGARRADTTTGVTFGTWHHACGIEYAVNSRAVFIDGGSKGTNAVAEAPTPDRTAIGRECDSTPDFYFSGRIAEVGVWSVALTDAEVAILAAGYSPLFVRPQSRVAYWPLIRDEDQDRVGGYDMTAFNAPSIAAHPPMIYPAPWLWGLAAADGAVYYETPAGTFTSSGALARLIATTKAGGLTPSGAIVRQTAAMKAGALGPAGVTARQTATSKAGAFTSSGSLVRQAQKAVAGALSSAGALVRQGQKAAAGTLSSAGAVIKQTATSKAGTLTTSGTLSTIRTFLRTVAGMLSTSGALVRQTGKSVAGAYSSAGAVIKRVAKSLAGALGLAGVLARYLLGWVPGDQTVTCLIVTETVTGEVTGVSVTGEVTEVAVTDELV